MTVPRETLERLKIYQDLLLRWNSRINLVAPASVHDIQTRHIDDCLQVSELADASAGHWIDLGSGGGLPGLVLAIAKAETDLVFTLVESDQRKAAFLRTVIRETGLSNTSVVAKRIEALSPLNAAYASARALAPLRQLVAYLHLHLEPTGTAFLMKGRQWQAEVEDARKEWVFDCLAHPSRTQEGAATLEISGVSHGAK
ncbi:16S rRNA (guanine(527)-N(7))-methyltransferase RsmG [Paracoccus benzoatiresistens]|uniref:Ribosomal RNA small subunit methyltransferase G n=1 Tax=Paracoccus benzoatiresistens TaxID=2997341 RepID=A0ABT4J2T0_9RHOB|nr:16S rRNA (guanine(527)-N(7))-methyltransferase RsmG [Paracoccus sp. EF6]MCZ0961397.1 16S rRNA (guanine(527)-N(7))-methyltransferase RsmG [Paracoccus sp. EF6]